MIRIHGARQSKVMFFDWKESVRCRDCPYLIEHGFMNGMPTTFCDRHGRKANAYCPVFEGKGGKGR